MIKLSIDNPLGKLPNGKDQYTYTLEKLNVLYNRINIFCTGIEDLLHCTLLCTFIFLFIFVWLYVSYIMRRSYGLNCCYIIHILSQLISKKHISCDINKNHTVHPKGLNCGNDSLLVLPYSITKYCSRHITY